MRKTSVLLCMFTLPVSLLWAQENQEEVYNPAHYQVSEPSIQFHGGDKTVFGIGGQVMVTGNFDFGATLSDPNYFIVNDIPMAWEKGFGSSVNMSAQQSGLQVMFKYLPGEKHQVSAYVCAYLLGNNYLPSIDYAFLTYRGILAGYNYTMFTDQEAMPSTIDHEGPAAYTGWQRAVFDVAGSWGKHWSAGVGMEINAPGFKESAAFAKAGQKMPDIPAFVRYRFSPNSWLRLSAVARNMFYYQEKEGKTKHAFGWGFQFSGGYEIKPCLQATWQAVGGKGITSYYQDFCGNQTLDLNPAENGSRLKDIGSWGAFIGLRYRWTDRWSSNIIYSHIRLYPDSGTINYGDQYKYSQNAIANIFYDINSHFRWGLEYDWGRRVNLDGESNHCNRIQTSLTFSF